MSQAAADSLVTEGNDLFRSERFGEAAARFERAVTVFPDHALGWRGLGHALLCLGRPHEAASAFDKAIGLAPESATALWGGALAHAEIGNAVVAQRYLRRTIALQPTWVSMAVGVPRLAHFLQIASRAADRMHAVFGAFACRRFEHAADVARAIEVGRIAGRPDPDRVTYLTVGLSNAAWREPERPRVELVMASKADADACPQILANLAFHLWETRFFPEPSTIVRNAVAAVGAGELSERLPHVYVQVPRAWGIELPLDEGPPAITLAQVFPISDREYRAWRELGAARFEQSLIERRIDLADLRRPG
jgi:tetratricopeptide (TPR) repeat protein